MIIIKNRNRVIKLFIINYRLIFLIIILLFATSILRLYSLEKPDTIEDEHSYIVDAQRLLNKDPYTSIRHHTFRHPDCCQGHPFLAQIFSVIIFKIGGVSSITARLPYAIAGILTVFAVLFFNNKFGLSSAYLSALILAIMPFAVRFSRLVHLDAISALWYTLSALMVWKYKQNNKLIYLIAIGIFIGLSVSTKLNGIILLFMVSLLLVFVKPNFKNYFSIKQLIITSRNIFCILFPALLIIFLLNDPGAYLDGILQPAPVYSLASIDYWIGAIKSISFWREALFNLLSPPLFIVWIISIIFLLKKGGNWSKFLLIWQGVTLSFFVFHRPGLSGEHGLLPALPPIALSTGYFITSLKLRSITIFLLLSILPFTFWYGMFLKPLPYRPDTYYANRTLRDTFYLDIINRVNELAPVNGNVFLLPQARYPIYALRSDVTWSYYDLNKANVFVVSDAAQISELKGNLSFIESREAVEDGEVLIRYIFVRNNF